MDAAATLRTARRESGLSQAELARRAGTSQATISAYESGSKEPALSTLERLLAATGHRLDVRPHAEVVPRDSPAQLLVADHE